MKLVKFGLVLIGLGLVFVFGFGYGRWFSTRAAPKSERKVLYYVDAMHPWYKSDKPGLAPDCGMKLEPVYADGVQRAGPNSAHERVLYYRDPKDPAYKSDKPGLNPATGNDLEAVYADTPSPGSLQIASDKQQLIGLRYGLAEYTSAEQVIHAAGRVVPDETLITRVQARTDGWITTVSADFTGKLIGRGQPLLTMYSPELLAAQQEYLLARKARTILQHSSMRESSANSEALAEAAKRRLMLLNLTPEQIAQVEETDKPIQSIALNSPVSGYVMTRNAFPGQRVSGETELYTLADLSGVWVMADIFEADAPQIRIGQGARIGVQGTGGTQFARVTYIQPQIDPVTRTLKVRLELANPRMRFKPDMFVDVEMALGGARRLSVPSEAVLDAGTSKTVFLDRGNGFFEPRQVETGVRFRDQSGDRVEILKGLTAGERIVTSGSFLLNSESQMRRGGGMADMPGMANGPKPGKEVTPAPGKEPAKGEMPDMPGMPKPTVKK
jgi:Cu(I)/Ag(I) efflux system membrane fusion protein